MREKSRPMHPIPRVPATDQPSASLLQEVTAMPGTRIQHLHSGWLATIVARAWPAIWVHCDADLERGRVAPRKVWGRIFSVVMPREDNR
jgi:hypothetical protein